MRLEAIEAVAIVQALASSAGIPSPDNVEIDSLGGVRCLSTRGEPTVPALAALLDRLLPAGRIQPALRYTVARGTGAVDAPPFASVDDFSRSLARFETSDRAQVIRGLISRARPVTPVIALPAPALVVDTPSLADIPLARTPSIAHTTRRGHRGVGVVSVLAALVISGLAGYVSVGVTRSPLAGLPIAVPALSEQTPSKNETPAEAAAAPVVVRRAAPKAAPTPSAVEPNAFSPAFSPAGTALFFQTGGAQDPTSAIEVARLDSGPSADLRIMKVVDDAARNYHARPSPDGRLIAFDSDRDGERAVFVADSDGGHVRRVSGDGYAALPSWSPDGGRLAFVRGEPGSPSVWNIWIQPLAGGPPQRITHFRYGQTWAASWFPDGHRIAYSHEDEVTILDLETSKAERFPTPVRGRLVRTPAVSPDGSRIVFQVYRAGAWMLNVRDGSMECVLADPTAEEFAWAPDGRRFAFHSRRGGEWGVYVLTTPASAR